MKKHYIIGLLLLSFLCFNTTAQAGFIKDIKVGKYQTWVDDMTAAAESNTGDRGNMYQNAFHRGWPACAVQNSGWYLGTTNWTAEDGDVWPLKLTGAAPVTYNEENGQMPVEDSEGYFIRRYMRYQPPTVVVDGLQVSDLWPLDGSDSVDPSKIPGTADILVTSKINTDMGVTITQNVFAWSQTNHDDYIVYEYIFENTGNIDLDDEIELPNQTLKDVYFLRASRMERWDSENWYSGRGEYEEDDLRVRYAYPGRRRDQGTVDGTGNGFWAPQPGWMWNSQTAGQAILHADKSTSDTSDDFNQPMMTGTENSDLLWIRNDPTSTGPADWQRVFRVMSEGWDWRGQVPKLTAENNPHPEKTIRPGNRSVRMEDLAVPGIQYILDLPWVTYGGSYFWAAGPYTMAPGESFRIVWADGFGVINPLKIWEVQTAWENGTAQPPEGMTFDNANGVGLNDNMPPPYKNNPSLYNNNYNDWAKDCWIFTGIDSFLTNMNNAQWNENNGWNVPTAPPPPSLTVNSRPNRIEVSWGDESESASDFAGYRLYRSEGFWYEGHRPWTSTDYEHGEWKLIGDFPGNSVHSFNDTDVTRGFDYFYKITAYDDGTQNGPDVDGGGKPLESGHFLSYTKTIGASLTRDAADDLSDVVVVPNPFNASATSVQFPGFPNKLVFYNLPGECTIRIYSESGDLVKKIDHTNGSGDESWGLLANEQMTSNTGQIVVSGIYIAHIETPDGKSTTRKIVIVR
ncbi:T9SS type A sorting domain-containing protein [candidate division KSB1 bacterium]|nr:T9SS type A sorting domain-containing protein [candidate division KSB1 bacterium]